MPRIGFHCSHEQIPPRELLAAVRHAEQAGFAAAMASDHFSPWSERQGESGFAWSFLGAALGATSLPFGVVNAPRQRYHGDRRAGRCLACQMFPGRLWVALGTGEASNEQITGGRWPSKAERNARLQECLEVNRALLAGEVVDHHRRVVVDRARLWTLPPEPSPLIGPAISVKTTSGWASRRMASSRSTSRPRNSSARNFYFFSRSALRKNRSSLAGTNAYTSAL
jgi:G6PDH family F420-dependent oxidoreductase